jgi:DNA-binding NtrC family response regulator
MPTHRDLVVYVDDELAALKYFKFIFGGLYDVQTFDRPAAALKYFESGGLPISVIVSDERMPECSGRQLLAESKHTHPDALRILTTAYFQDELAAAELVAKGDLWGFIEKPWHNNPLKVLLQQAIEVAHLRAKVRAQRS